MVRVQLKSFIEFQHPDVKVFDLHEELGLACLVDDGESATVYLNELRCRSWRREDHPFVYAIRWFSEHQVIAWLVEYRAAVISTDSWDLLSIGRPEKILLSNNRIFAGYGDEFTTRAIPGEVEINVVAVFSRDGQPEFGLDEIFCNAKYKGTIVELNAGYTFGERLIFNAYSADYLWALDAPSKSCKKFPIPFETTLIDVLSGDDKQAVAIMGYHAPFELAVFDLVSETSSKQDFAPVDAALTDAGFVMSEIKFQPNSTGKIIVRDRNKAAPLEFSGLP